MVGVETRLLSFAELEARAEHITALASLSVQQLQQLHPRILLHSLPAHAEFPENLRERVVIFMVSGSLDTFSPEGKPTEVFLSLKAGDFCSASDLLDSNLGAKAGSDGLVILTLPDRLWHSALHERERDSAQRLLSLSDEVFPATPSAPHAHISHAKWLPTSMRLERFKGGRYAYVSTSLLTYTIRRTTGSSLLTPSRSLFFTPSRSLV
jgi:hypothetical protein